MSDLLAFATPIPTNAAQVAAIWAIRLALVFMVSILAIEAVSRRKVKGGWAALWFVGALCASAHSLGALAAFHQWNHAQAFESTAQQTEELLGIRVGIGLYVNYLFVLVWLLDASIRLWLPSRYVQLPKLYTYCVYGFLLFIAFNGAVVFKTGWLRVAGILVVLILATLCLASYRRSAKISLVD